MADEKRLIDANALAEGLELLAKHEAGFRQSVILGVMHSVKAQPTVDAVEVVHGWWNEEDERLFDTVYQCSACKEEFVTMDGTPADNLWNYCPNCGAKMDGERSAGG